jgi:hypothetical protein
MQPRRKGLVKLNTCNYVCINQCINGPISSNLITSFLFILEAWAGNTPNDGHPEIIIVSQLSVKVRLRWTYNGRFLVQNRDKSFLAKAACLPGHEKPGSESPITTATLRNVGIRIVDSDYRMI